MARTDNAGGTSTSADSRPKSILPLPEDVVAQIKSSTAIVSLVGVVLELLANSLDGGATKIEAAVDFARGGCTVEDDGLGISPLEFGEDGGLGKLYYTSKYFSVEPSLGRNGTFLASLAAVSLLTITSHHHEHRSHNSVTFHNSKAVERQRPALARNEIRYEKHGTRVTVRNLFGNLPVRVKQRAAIEEQTNEKDRLWDALRRDITGLVLSWRHPVSLKLRDANHKTLFNLNRETLSTSTSRSRDAGLARARSAELASVLSTLTQASYIAVDDWSSWIPVSASTPAVSIKGAIALDPAPTKRVQFISLGLRPLLASFGNNELYDDVNRHFSLSDFGTLEDDADIDDTEKLRRKGDRRFTNDGYSHRQLKGRKGVDRHPMFYLRISLQEDVQCHRPEERFLENGTNLQTVITVLDAMLTQWLSVHHFRPRKSNGKKQGLDTNSTSLNDSDAEAAASTPLQLAVSKVNRGRISSGKSTPTKSDNRKRKRSSKAPPNVSDASTQQRPFAEWSRIKSSRASFLDTMQHFAKQLVPHSELEPSASTADASHIRVNASNVHAGTSISCARTSPEFKSADAHDADFQANINDAIMEWQDPSTKQVLLLNARTGCAVPRAPSRTHTDGTTTSHLTTLTEFNKSLRLPKRPATGPKDTPWLDEVLQNWDNPIFRTSEQRIQQVSLDEGCGGGNHHLCSRVEIDKAFNESSLPGTSKLSKDGLRRARVIAQLDRKFILVKITNTAQPSGAGESDVLIIIDQHAADERIRVEALFSELCAPPTSANKTYRSRLGLTSQVAFSILEKPIQFTISSPEEALVATHAARFAAWGILYHTEPPNQSNAGLTTRAKPQPVLSVRTLPPAISERCKADPKLLINLLRATVWKYAEDPAPPLPPPSLPLPLNPQPDQTASNDTESPSWLRQLATCPPGLIDMINSRACRSAVMFNDELGVTECEGLVERLGSCVFPFMCAHGRPSMVPLVDLGGEGGRDGVGLGLVGGMGEGKGNEKEMKGGGGQGMGVGEGFVGAWKRWRALHASAKAYYSTASDFVYCPT
ncbi:hypothetical protein K491DRAFT_759719 [Lophiostoma macrostomum CBS 122681]|uniref:MutL C-terminal dimerisation domain-containing protein n=1 Tax=Lophiostoma macrostomum CBS 122681 TaxID=1314788 RepID=A0A6A6T080_9PLEO|nr:hypothetical protein K491DRAFT_759719 [Lophiostoma macrostomum CBS 122681]